MLKLLRRKKYRVKDPMYLQSCQHCGFVLAVCQCTGVLSCPRCFNTFECVDTDPALVLEVEL